MDNRFFVLVLQETESNERTPGHSFSSVFWDVLEMDSHSGANLGNRQLGSMMN